MLCSYPHTVCLKPPLEQSFILLYLFPFPEGDQHRLVPRTASRTCCSTTLPDTWSTSLLPAGHTNHTLAFQGVNSPLRPGCTSEPTWEKKWKKTGTFKNAQNDFCLNKLVFTSAPEFSGHCLRGWKPLWPDASLLLSTCQNSLWWCGSIFLATERGVKQVSAQCRRWWRQMWTHVKLRTCSKMSSFFGGPGSATARWARNRCSSTRLGSWSISTSVKKLRSCNTRTRSRGGTQWRRLAFKNAPVSWKQGALYNSANKKRDCRGYTRIHKAPLLI